MTLPSNVTASSALLAAGVWIVGATFLWAGIIKAVEPHVFQRHLVKLGAIKPRFTGAALITVAGLEAGWGTALNLGLAPGFVLPLTAALLVALTAVSWWGVRSGRTTDCGCYGGYVVPSLAQSLLLNGAFAGLTLAAWLAREPADPAPLWKSIAAAGAGALVAGFAAASLSFFRKHERFLVDLNPLKVGRRWRSRWGARIPADDGEHLVSYLGPDCPHCKRWVRVLNAVDQSKELPSVVGIVGTSNEAMQKFVENSGIRFPMRVIPQTLMTRLAWGVPTTVLVSGGRIQNRWSGQMPAEFFERFRDAFFPGAERQQAATADENGSAPRSSATSTSA
jgi:hypothetical protein